MERLKDTESVDDTKNTFFWTQQSEAGMNSQSH